MTPSSDVTRGSLLPLVAGLVALCGVTIVGVIDSTDLALTRTSLQSAADMAALVGAESFDPTDAVFDGARVQVRLTNRRIRQQVRRFVADSTEAVRLVDARTTDGVTARVTVRTVWTPPLGNQFFPLTIPIEATASARIVIRG
jgi:uncharacterized membrane protein